MAAYRFNVLPNTALLSAFFIIISLPAATELPRLHYNLDDLPMVPDGYYYGLAMIAAAALLGWLAGPLWALPACLLALFFLWFFRDPERVIPDSAGALVSPADGKVTDVASIVMNGVPLTRISIFLSVFDVHVNRSPVAGVIREVRYQKGKFLNAMNPASAEHNEQNAVTVEGDGPDCGFQADRRTAGAPHRVQQESRRYGEAGRARGPDQVWFARRRFAGCFAPRRRSKWETA